jgi:hypothetical protein
MGELQGYNDSILYAQDYSLYLRLMEKHKIYKMQKGLEKFCENLNRNSTNIITMLIR